MKSNKSKFTASFYFDDDGRLKGFETVAGKVVKQLNPSELIFEGIFSGKKQRVVLPTKNVFNSKEEAEKKIEAALAWKERKTLKETIETGNPDFLPPLLAEPKEILVSSNPLRAGEPMICFGAQTNTWGEADNPQKVLQVAGAIWEDIEVLKAVLYVLGQANNYTKKIIGKYIVIELNSLYSCLSRLAELDDRYKSSFDDLQSKILRLEKKYNFRAIRNQIAAHRDPNVDIMTATNFWKNITRFTINRYIEAFCLHLTTVFQLYPFESKSYFGMQNIPLNGVLGTEKTDEYQTFDEIFIAEQKKSNDHIDS